MDTDTPVVGRITFSSVSDPNTWGIDGDPKRLVFASPSEAKRAEELFTAMQRALAEARAERDTHKKSLDMLYGEKFSDRSYHALKSRAERAEAECERLRMESERLCSLIDATEINADHFTWRRSPRSSAQAIREEMDAIFGLKESK